MPPQNGLPFRQIHLDFHTSEHITGVGAKFDGARFAETLVSAKVDSIVLFAKCHHGWSYYDSAVGARHPNLDFELLTAQVEACRAAGIRYTVYISVGWDERAARDNPGWRRILPDGSFEMVRGRNLGASWSYLCMNTPYLDYLTDQIGEACDRYPDTDGLWLDIIRETPCCCSYCRSGMDAAGLDWTQQADQSLYAQSVLRRYFERTLEAARRSNPDLGIFHNSGMVPRGNLTIYDNFSHVEIEALPTGGWGYDHFPLSARYIDPTGLPFMGVTGRFHYTWGELGGLKHPNALRAELGTMIAHGARLCIGDHLDPGGELDADSYRMIGDAYAEVIPAQAIVEGTRPIADIGLISSVGERRPGTILRDARNCPEDVGALRILQQGHLLFDTIDGDADFDRYRLLILPDLIRLDAALAEKLARYVERGGAVLLTYESGLNLAGDGFALDIGAAVEGPLPFSTSYVAPLPELAPDYIARPFSVMAPALAVRPQSGTVAARLFEPLFERHPRHFSGHQHAPPRAEWRGQAGAVRRGRVLYYAHKLFSLYREMGSVAIKQYVLAGIRSLLTDPTVVATTLPSTATITVRRAPGRRLVQLVYAPREARGESIRGLLEIIEDLPVLADVSVSLSFPDFRVEAARVVHGEATLAPVAPGHAPVLRFDRLRGHVMVELTGAETGAAQPAIADATAAR